MKKERVEAALDFKETDIVPYNIELTGELLERVLSETGIDKAAFPEWVGNHCEKISYNIGGKYIKEGIFKDEFGVVWNRTGLDKDIGTIEEYLIPSPDINNYVFPEPDLDAVAEKTEKILVQKKDIFCFGKIGTTFFERAWSLTGMENLLTYFLLEEDFVKELFDKILEYNIKIIDRALEFDIDGMYFGDDYGGQHGLLMSPEVWRKFIKPGLQTMFSRIKNKGKVVALHSCGNIEALLDDFIEIGLDIYQTVQPEVYDVKALKSKYDGKLTFWGGISTQQELPFLKPEELKSCVLDRISIMGRNGGYIAAPTHRIPRDVSVDNVLALVEVFKEQKK